MPNSQKPSGKVGSDFGRCTWCSHSRSDEQRSKLAGPMPTRIAEAGSMLVERSAGMHKPSGEHAPLKRVD